MAAPNPIGMAGASADLGLGSMLSDQVRDETEEERKKRMLRQQQLGQLSPASQALGLGPAGLDTAR